MHSWLYTCPDQILFAIIWTGHSLSLDLPEDSPSALVFPTNNFVFVLFKFFISLLIHLAFLCSGFPLLLTSLPFPFFHLSKDSQYPSDFFTWTHRPSHSLSAAYTIQKSHTPFFVLSTLPCGWNHVKQSCTKPPASEGRLSLLQGRERERERTGCSCQANEVIFRNFQKYSWCHFYFLKAIENKVVGFVNRKKRIY